MLMTSYAVLLMEAAARETAETGTTAGTATITVSVPAAVIVTVTGAMTGAMTGDECVESAMYSVVRPWTPEGEWSDLWRCDLGEEIVWSNYNNVITNNWHPIAYPWGQGIGCLLWVENIT